MRKVYQNERNLARLPLAIILALLFTALLFGFIPFAHRVSHPKSVLELRTARATEAPPPAEEAPPPPQIEQEKPPEAPPDPQLTESKMDIPITASLDVAIGSGPGFMSSSEIRSLTSPQAIKEETFDVSELEKRPEVISQVDPAYPSELKKAKVEGAVTLVFLLSEEGRVEDARVEKSSRTEFEKPALDAIRKWRFSPGMKDGKAVRTYIRVPMRFRVTTG